MSELRVLTVRQPWAWAIIHGGKDVENRVRNIAGDYRGPVAIHAGHRYDERTNLGRWPFHAAMENAIENAGGEVHGGVFTWDLGQPDPRRWLHELGSIIGVVDLVDVHYCDECVRLPSIDAVPAPRMCSPWSDTRSHHLVFADPRPLAEPIPYRGGSGLRRVDPIFGRGVLNEAAWTAAQGGQNDA